MAPPRRPARWGQPAWSAIDEEPHAWQVLTADEVPGGQPLRRAWPGHLEHVTGEDVDRGRITGVRCGRLRTGGGQPRIGRRRRGGINRPSRRVRGGMHGPWDGLAVNAGSENRFAA